MQEAFLDYKTYALFLFYLSSNVPLGGLSTFAAQIVSGLGYSSLETTLLGMPTGMFQTFAGLMVAVPQRWLKNKRCLSSGLCCLVPLVLLYHYTTWVQYHKLGISITQLTALLYRVAGREHDRETCLLLLFLFLLGPLCNRWV